MKLFKLPKFLKTIKKEIIVISKKVSRNNALFLVLKFRNRFKRANVNGITVTSLVISNNALPKLLIMMLFLLSLLKYFSERTTKVNNNMKLEIISLFT
jgi:hypothetical protein